jgi:hypothetical protein
MGKTMNLSSIIIGTALVISIGTAAAADERVDHLEPPYSAMDTPPEYDLPQIIHTVFHEAWDSDIRVRRFTSNVLGDYDDMIALRESKDEFSIVYLHQRNLIFWYSDMGRRFRSDRKLFPKAREHPLVPAGYHDLKPERCQFGISASLGNAIIKVWQSVLMDTRYYRAEPFPPMDGSWYEFSMDEKNQTAFGQTAGRVSDAVEQGSKAGLLVKISFDMEQLCRSRSVQDRSQLAADVRELEKLDGAQNQMH